jgi:hypothetical protein
VCEKYLLRAMSALCPRAALVNALFTVRGRQLAFLDRSRLTSRTTSASEAGSPAAGRGVVRIGGFGAEVVFGVAFGDGFGAGAAVEREGDG